MKLSFWGPFIGLIGGIIGIIGGGLNLCDRFIPPTVEAIEVLPVYVWSVEKVTIDNRERKKPRRGFSVIVRLRSKSRNVFISGLEVSGKQRMTLDEWAVFDGKNSENIRDIEMRYNQKKPYYRVSWTGWLDDSRVPIKLEPHEERYIRFTLVEPHMGTRGRIMDEKYIGYDDGTKIPHTVKYHAEAWDFFESEASREGMGWEPVAISDDIKNEKMIFSLRVGAKSIVIPYQKFRPFKKVREKDWNEKDVQNIFYDRDY